MLAARKFKFFRLQNGIWFGRGHDNPDRKGTLKSFSLDHFQEYLLYAVANQSLDGVGGTWIYEIYENPNVP
jgi:hypothetical protein